MYQFPCKHYISVLMFKTGAILTQSSEEVQLVGHILKKMPQSFCSYSLDRWIFQVSVNFIFIIFLFGV